MGKIIFVQFRRPKLPHRLLKDGWWLQTAATPSNVIILPPRRMPEPVLRPKRRFGHLVLITSEK